MFNIYHVYALSHALLMQTESVPAQPEGIKAVFYQVAPLALMGLAFYFLMLRPMWKQNKQQQDFLKSLKKDDEVVTSAGFYGKIYAISEHVITLEIAPSVRLKVLRGSISGKWKPSSEASGESQKEIKA